MSSLRLIEIFSSVQGESSTTGQMTTFIRLAACNLRCSWCDTTYSFGRGEPMEIEAILTRVREGGCRYVCVTGGEPLLQAEVYPLMKQLCDEGYFTTLETSGSIDISSVDPRVTVILDVKCPGSGMSHKNLWINFDSLPESAEVKFVISDEEDYRYAKTVCQSYGLYDRHKPPLFSPVFGQLEPRTLVEWILADQLPVRLNLQVHKYIWAPDTKGV